MAPPFDNDWVGLEPLSYQENDFFLNFTFKLGWPSPYRSRSAIYKKYKELAPRRNSYNNSEKSTNQIYRLKTSCPFVDP